jgi:glutathione S-transferase/alpha,alpha-trehalase
MVKLPTFVTVPVIAFIIATATTTVDSFTTTTTTTTIAVPQRLPRSSRTSGIAATALHMSSSSNMDTSTLTLYGHPGSRSPLINWACYELGFEIKVASDLSMNPHPFGQLPCLTDKDDVVIFESGAILLYLLQYYRSNEPSSTLSKEQLAAITSWVVWANASLDPICFLETPNGKVYDTGLRQPNRRMDQLNSILSNQSYLVSSDNNESVFTIADVAIVSYLAYVLQFFPDVTIADKWPAVASYMQNCINRPTYGQAFTTTTQNRLLNVLEKDIAAAASGNGAKDKKLFGMF